MSTDIVKSKRSIMLADDDPFIIELYQSKLKSEGFDVLPVKDGEEALLKLDSFQPDLLILDMNMPRMNGMEVLRYIRSHPEKSKMPVIVLSNACTDSMMAEIWELNPSKFLTKRDSKPNNVLAEVRAVFSEMPAEKSDETDAAIQENPERDLSVESSSGTVREVLQTLAESPSIEKSKGLLLESYKLLHDQIESLGRYDPRQAGTQFARSFEKLYDDLYSHPELINASTCRTLLQAAEMIPAVMSRSIMDKAPLLKVCRTILMSEDVDLRNRMAELFDKPGFEFIRVRDLPTAVMLAKDNQFDFAVFDVGRASVAVKTKKRLQADDCNYPGRALFLLGADQFRRLEDKFLDPVTDAAILPPMQSEIILKATIGKLAK